MERFVENEDWPPVCRLFTHNEASCGPGYVVTVRLPSGFEFNRQLSVAQAHSVYITLKFIHSPMGSVFSCHCCGFGKTTSIFAVVLIQHIMNILWTRVECEPEDHYSSDRPGSTCLKATNLKQHYGFDCPCEPTSSTHFIKKRYGSVLLFVPLGLLPNWEKEWRLCCGRDQDRPGHTGMYMYKAHAHKNMVAGSLKGYPANVQELLPAGKLRNSRLIMMTTDFASAKSQIFSPTMVNGQLSAHFSICIRDEMHIRCSETIKAIKFLQDIQGKSLDTPDYTGPSTNGTFNRVALIIMSGTPLDNGPSEFLRFADLMCTASWGTDNLLGNWDEQEGHNMAEEFKKLFNGRKPGRMKLIQEALGPRIGDLVTRLMHQWGDFSQIMGHPVCKLPEHVVRVITVKLDAKWASKLDKLITKETDKLNELTRVNKLLGRDVKMSAWVARIKSPQIVNIPYFMVLTGKNGVKLRLTRDEIEENTKGKNPNWVYGTDSDPYYRHYQDIYDSSPKLQWIVHQAKKYRKSKDIEGKTPRIILASRFIACVRVLGYVCIKEFGADPGVEYAQLDTLMTAKERLRQEDLFHADIDSDIPPSQQQTAEFFGLQSRAGSAGLNLQEARHLIILEPDPEPVHTAQIQGRHNRPGQKNTKISTDILVVEGNAIEARAILDSQIRGESNKQLKRRVDDENGVQSPGSQFVAQDEGNASYEC